MTSIFWETALHNTSSVPNKLVPVDQEGATCQKQLKNCLKIKSFAA